MHETYQDYIDLLGPETTRNSPQALLYNHNKISKLSTYLPRVLLVDVPELASPLTSSTRYS